MPRFRMGRINSQLQREISLILSREVRDEKLAEVIVTSVECSKDLKYAKVYYTTLREEGRAEVAKLLEKVSGYVRSLLGRVLSYRTVPELTFRFDDSEELAREMDRVLDRISAELPPEESEALEDASEESDD
ncbi:MULTISPECIES: 30S ribosome-binding factor RbfA [unclassified Pyramidobacter]|uniref:30S ribosome-binding factor RbfA n=1 Tax=unclassified Pyramidobacter TaxID=2632171 RepID=UPI0025DCC822|nr:MULTISPECIES: 30S ribosome-binding factor RbfA [unclassified Pyramidobacter]MDY3212400.1 30S ribosome-binding factor RbfA [Pyramidobacter sp.]WOL39382.1 30S ribosome-binding factor RbfA [Pyramidobacter sp. YE332]